MPPPNVKGRRCPREPSTRNRQPEMIKSYVPGCGRGRSWSWIASARTKSLACARASRRRERACFICRLILPTSTTHSKVLVQDQADLGLAEGSDSGGFRGGHDGRPGQNLSPERLTLAPTADPWAIIQLAGRTQLLVCRPDHRHCITVVASSCLCSTNGQYWSRGGNSYPESPADGLDGALEHVEHRRAQEPARRACAPRRQRSRGWGFLGSGTRPALPTDDRLRGPADSTMRGQL